MPPLFLTKLRQLNSLSSDDYRTIGYSNDLPFNLFIESPNIAGETNKKPLFIGVKCCPIYSYLLEKYTKIIHVEDCIFVLDRK